MIMKKDRFTFSIDPSLSKKFKELCDERGLKYSSVLVNFVEFFVNPEIYCFTCKNKFEAKNEEICVKCGWIICPSCEVCGCSLDEKIVDAIYQMRRTFEDLLMGRVNQ